MSYVRQAEGWEFERYSDRLSTPFSACFVQRSSSSRKVASVVIIWGRGLGGCILKLPSNQCFRADFVTDSSGFGLHLLHFFFFLRKKMSVQGPGRMFRQQSARCVSMRIRICQEELHVAVCSVMPELEGRDRWHWWHLIFWRNW